MRGRWASAALGAGIARRRAGREMEEQQGAYDTQMSQAQQQIEAQQRQIEGLQQQKQNPQSQHEDLTQKLKKYGDLETTRNINGRRISKTQGRFVIKDVI